MNPNMEIPALPAAATNQVYDLTNLMSHLEQIQDPRKARGVRYQLSHLLTWLILAKLGGQDSMRGMAKWVQLRSQALTELLGLSRRTTPHQTTYERILVELDEGEVESILGHYFAQQITGHAITISLDGKTLRGTIPAGSTQGVHLLAAYVPEEGVVLMQVEVGHKDNEIVAAPQLLSTLDLRHHVVTGDAMLTQRDICQQIVLAGGHYLFPVKANQPSLQEAIAETFVPPPVVPGHHAQLPEFPTAQTIEKNRDRIEYRYLTTTTLLNDYLDWPHLGQVFRLQRVTWYQQTHRLTYQVVFGVTSLSPEQAPPDHLLDSIRRHWHIENRLHYVRDATFHEDDCSIRQPKRQRLLAILNNLVIGLIRQCDFEFVPEARLYFDYHFEDAFQRFFL